MPPSTITLNGKSVTLVPMPAMPGLRAVDWNCRDGIGAVTAPFSGKVQAQQWQGGDMWSGKATLPMMVQADADNWIAWLEELRGKLYAFQMGDPWQSIRGSMAGAPQVDNTINGGNLPGMQSVGLKGFAPSATGVLLPGDYMQLGFRLYRVLDSINADASGKAIVPIWPSLREQPPNNGTSAGWINATGSCTKFHSVSLGGYFAGVQWSNFTIPPLPADAVIQGIYPVIVCSAVYDICFQVLRYGPGLLFTNGPTGTEFHLPSPPAPVLGATFASTEFYDLGPGIGPGANQGIGTSLDDLADQEIMMLLASSQVQFPIVDSMTATAVGFAVYYASAAPTTDTLIPAPFTVPAGQGVAWSVPLGTAVSYNSVTGTAVGAAAIDNGLLHQNPVGIWRLKSNDRDWRSDFQSLTQPQFEFQEYR